jgi:hypothetical protein
MPCDAGRACVHDHIKAHLRQPKPSADGNGYRALAPCHDDSTHSLSVSAGRDGAPVWNCFACSKRLGRDAAQTRTRSALIRDGVSPRCLPMTREQVDSMIDEFRIVLHSDLSQVEKVYRLAALVECGEMPRGGELDRLADWCGVSRRAAYKATSAGSLGVFAISDNPVPRP